MSKVLTFTLLLILTPIRKKKSPELFIKFLTPWSIFIVWILFIMISSQKTLFLILKLELWKLSILGRLFRWTLLFKLSWDKEELSHILLLNIFKAIAQEKWISGHVDWYSTTFWMASFIFMTKIEIKCAKRFLKNRFNSKVHFSFYSGYNWINRSP